jgi:hypothetical protein
MNIYRRLLQREFENAEGDWERLEEACELLDSFTRWVSHANVNPETDPTCRLVGNTRSVLAEFAWNVEDLKHSYYGLQEVERAPQGRLEWSEPEPKKVTREEQLAACQCEGCKWFREEGASSEAV